jgi:hypothetical protein
MAFRKADESVQTKLDSFFKPALKSKSKDIPVRGHGGP